MGQRLKADDTCWTFSYVHMSDGFQQSLNTSFELDNQQMLELSHPNPQTNDASMIHLDQTWSSTAVRRYWAHLIYSVVKSQTES